MFKLVPEQEFLSRINLPIQYIGIYELDFVIDDNQLDCEGIIVAFGDKQYLIRSLAIGEDTFDFFYYEFTAEYTCRKILPAPEEPLFFISKEKEHHSILRFQIGNRPILATAFENGLLTIGISHWGIHGDWLAFENNHLLSNN